MKDGDEVRTKALVSRVSRSANPRRKAVGSKAMVGARLREGWWKDGGAVYEKPGVIVEFGRICLLPVRASVYNMACAKC